MANWPSFSRSVGSGCARLLTRPSWKIEKATSSLAGKDENLSTLVVDTSTVINLHASGHGKAILSALRSEEHTSELQSLMRISYAVFCLKKTLTDIRRANDGNSFTTAHRVSRLLLDTNQYTH